MRSPVPTPCRISRALLIGLVPLLLGSGGDSFRFRWTKGDVFSYRMEAEVREGEVTSKLVGTFTLSALSPTAAILDRQISSLLQTIGDEPPREATPTELASMRALVPIGPDGDVPEEAALGDEEKQGVRGFIASLFPFPPAGEAPAKGTWPLRISGQGDLLVGEGRIVRKVAIEGHPSVEIRFRAVSSDTGRRMAGTAFFSSELGAFVKVTREILSPGPPERKESLSLLLRRHPSGPVLDRSYRKELEIAREATGRDPKNPAAWARLCRVLRSGGAGEEALEAARKAAALEPGETSHRVAEGEVLGILGRLDEAEKALSAVLRDHPEETMARLHLSRVLFQKAEFPGAAAAAVEVLRRDPDSSDGMFLLGIARAKLGEVEEAKALIRKSLGPPGDGEPPAVTFDGEGNLRLIVPKPRSGVSGRAPLTPEEREAAKQILGQIVSEEAGRQEMETAEIDRIMEYIASACGTDPPEMIADFLADRLGTVKRIDGALSERREIPLDEMRKLAASEDRELRMGAAFYLPLEEGIPLVRGAIKEDPANPVPYLHLASMILRQKDGVARHGEEALRALRAGRDLDPENGIYGYLLASIHLDQGKTLLALGEFADSIGRRAITTYRVKEARLRRRALTEVGFDPVFRGAAAWAHSGTPFAAPLGRAAEGVIAFAGLMEDEGKAADGRKFIESVLLAAAQARDSSDEVRLVREAGRIELLGLKALVGLDGRAADEEALRESKGWMESARREALLRLAAVEGFVAERDEALRLWPIIDPARYRDYLRRTFAGERRIFEGHLQEVRRNRGGRDGE